MRKMSGYDVGLTLGIMFTLMGAVGFGIVADQAATKTLPPDGPGFGLAMAGFYFLLGMIATGFSVRSSRKALQRTSIFYLVCSGLSFAVAFIRPANTGVLAFAGGLLIAGLLGAVFGRFVPVASSPVVPAVATSVPASQHLEGPAPTTVSPQAERTSRILLCLFWLGVAVIVSFLLFSDPKYRLVVFLFTTVLGLVVTGLLPTDVLVRLFPSIRIGKD